MEVFYAHDFLEFVSCLVFVFVFFVFFLNNDDHDDCLRLEVLKDSPALYVAHACAMGGELCVDGYIHVCCMLD